MYPEMWTKARKPSFGKIKKVGNIYRQINSWSWPTDDYGTEWNVSIYWTYLDIKF